MGCELAAELVKLVDFMIKIKIYATSDVCNLFMAHSTLNLCPGWKLVPFQNDSEILIILFLAVTETVHDDIFIYLFVVPNRVTR